MPNRLLGAIVLAGCLGAAAYGIWAFAQTSVLASTLGSVAPEIDAGDWAIHWRVSSAALFFISCFGICTGVGLLFQKRWALPFLAAVCGVWLLLQFGVEMLGFSRYPFEALDPVEIILVSVIALGALYASRRERRGSPNA